MPDQPTLSGLASAGPESVDRATPAAAAPVVAAGGPSPRIARLVVEVEPIHLDRLFDYVVPESLRDVVVPGQRVQVAFSGRSRRALVVEVGDTTDVPPGRLRPLKRLLGEQVWATPEDLALWRWAADRFASPLADVVRHALPGRTIDVERRAVQAGWLPEDRSSWVPKDMPIASVPSIAELPGAWEPYGTSGQALWDAVGTAPLSAYWRPLPGEDVGARLAELAARSLSAGRGVLVLVPDPVSRAADGVVAAMTEAGHEVVDVRGGPSPRVQYDRWLRARTGRARVVVGERGAAFTPLVGLGLAVVVDEANPAFKERRSPRHHAREVVLERARRTGAVGLLVGLVPSAPAWRLLTSRRLAPVIADRAVERAAAPLVRVADERGGVRTRFSSDAVRAVRAAVADGEYAVVLAARRGEGRALVCAACRQRVICPDCQGSTEPVGARLGCGACGWQGIRRCRSCGADRLVPLAAGTQRLAKEIAANVDVPVVVLEGYAPAGTPPAPAVLVVTRGAVLDHPPGPVGAVVLADLDALLRRPFLDAKEDALRLCMQLAGWTALERPASAGARGMREASARVIVQSQEPDGSVVRALVAWDPRGFWTAESAMRSVLRFPPAAHAIHLDAPNVDPSAEDALGDALREALPAGDDVLGPLPAGDRRRFLIKADDRAATLRALAPIRHDLSKANVDVRIDVDPVQVG